MRGPGVKDASSGVLLVAIGLFFAWSGRSLVMTSDGQMGPGYFPMLLAGLLVLLGVLVFAGSFRQRDERPDGRDGRGTSGVPRPGRAWAARARACARLLFEPPGLPRLPPRKHTTAHALYEPRDERLRADIGRETASAVQKRRRPEAGFAGREAKRGLPVHHAEEGARGGPRGSLPLDRACDTGLGDTVPR